MRGRMRLLVGVVLGVLLLAAWYGRQREELLVALDAATGRVVWAVPLPPGEAIARNVGSERTVYASEGRLFAWMMDPMRGLYARLGAWDAATGTLLWTWEASGETLGRGFPPYQLDFMFSGPQRVYASVHQIYLLWEPDDDTPPDAPHLLVALDAATGEGRWRVEGPWLFNSLYSLPPLVEAGGSVVLLREETEGQVALEALSMVDYQPRWLAAGVASRETLGTLTSDPPLLSDGMRVFLVSAHAVAAYDPATGAMLWQQTYPEEIKQVLPGASGLFLRLAEAAQQQVVALDPATGAEHWRAPAGAGAALPVLGISGAGPLYLAHKGSTPQETALVALDPTSGHPLWQATRAMVGAEKGAMGTGMVPSTGTLILYDGEGGTDSLRSLAAADGRERWSVRGPRIHSTLSSDGSRLFFWGEWPRWRLWLARVGVR